MSEFVLKPQNDTTFIVVQYLHRFLHPRFLNLHIIAVEIVYACKKHMTASNVVWCRHINRGFFFPAPCPNMLLPKLPRYANWNSFCSWKALFSAKKHTFISVLWNTHALPKIPGKRTTRCDYNLFVFFISTIC